MEGEENAKQNKKYDSKTHSEIHRSRSAVYYMLGIIEVLLAFRFVFKALGANPASPIVTFLYGITGILLTPFSGIFRTFTGRGVETQSVMEPSVIIAALVYAAGAWGIVKLLDIAYLKREGVR